MKNLVYCIIPNWNGKESIGDAIESLQAQQPQPQIVVVENGSVDGSADYISQKYPGISLLQQPKNLGFAGGVNVGIRYALENGAELIALFNNDAVADKNWLKHLVAAAKEHPQAGIITGKFVDIDNTLMDSTGDIYTTWGLPFPRGRGEAVSNKYDHDNWVFGATGGASLYSAEMLKMVGLFDEDFFAYYEDIDISFRAQLAGWKVYYQPTAIAYHQIGATSAKIKGFTTYQASKNLPMILWKNVPWQLWPTVFPRLFLVYWGFMLKAWRRGDGLPATKGHLKALWLLPKKFWERHKIQKHRTVSVDYIRSILVWDLPHNAKELRKARDRWWRLTGRKVA
jgi:GT2 family glycosyltransferase